MIKVAQAPPQPGLWVMDSVPDDHFMQFGYTDPNRSCAPIALCFDIYRDKIAP